MKPILIAIGSKSKVGKDFFADLLAKFFPFTRLFFAEGAYKIHDFTLQQLCKPVEKNRELLQFNAEGLKDLFNDPCLWVTPVEKVVEKEYKVNNIVITDLRLKEEWEMVKKYGFTTVRINRKERVMPKNPNHRTEVELDDYDWDIYIDNDGSESELLEKAKILFEKLTQDNEERL